MNKQIISWGMMLAAAFTLTNCTKEIDNPNQEPETSGIPFELVATSVDTKTDNTAGVVAWSADDAINIFHAEATTDAYINDGSFTIQEADLNDGRFTGNLKEGETLSAEKYDWYAFYPYTSQIATPANTSKGWTPVGSKHNEKQAQYGYDNMDHISGANYPLYGVAKNVASNDRPSITMNHAYSIAKIVVKNTTEQELTVETVSFTAPVNIVGTYYINFADESLTFTNSGDSYVSKTAELEVSNGTALQTGAEAAFYVAFVPFTAGSGETLTLSVNGYSKEIKLTKDVTFTAGKIKTLNFAYDKETSTNPEGEDFSGDWLITGSNSGKLYVATAVDNGNGNNLKSTLQITINDNMITEVDGLSDCKMTIEKITDGGTYDGMYTIKDAKGKYLYAASTSSNYLKGDTELSEDSYWDITLNDNGTYKIVATKSSNRNIMQFNYNNGTPLVSCYAASTITMTPITLYEYSMVVPDPTPRIVVVETLKSSVPAEGDEVTFAYELRNLDGEDVNVTVSDAGMIKAEAENGVVTVTVAQNDGKARTATITLSCGEAENVVLTVEQLAAPTTGGDVVPGNSYTYTFSAKQWTANGVKTLNSLSWTLAGDGNYWGYDATKGQQFGSGNAPYKSMTLSTSNYEGGVEKIVINTSGASNIAGSLVVTVGGVQYGSKVTLTKTATSYTFEAPDTGMQQGEIVLTYTQTSSKAIYIKSISINN